MALNRCPRNDELSAFVNCNLSDQEAERIESHVEGCPACEETVVGLEKTADTVFRCVRNAPAVLPFEDEVECQRMVESVVKRPFAVAQEISSEAKSTAALEKLRDYRIIEKIGEGGMGTVYRAVHTRLNKTVALKVLSSTRLKDPSAVSRFQREMSIVGRLQHPNIVHAHDAGEEDGQHFLVMEFVEGTDLAGIGHRHGPLAVAAACEVIAQAAAGLQYAHENGLVHRDIKPSNLMLALSSDKRTNEGSAAVVKILDLGLARLHTDDKESGPELTTDGQIMGTLDYMAPEQGSDSHAVDIRADIYSLGATLYKLLTGEVVFGGERHRSAMQKLTALATEPAPSVRERRPEVPESLAAIVGRMLAKQPQDRFATPAEVASALRPYCAGAELPSLLGLSSHASAALPSGPTAQLASDIRPPKRRPPLAVAAKWFFGAAAMLAIILTIWTKHGTIEIESPDGKLPDDVKVIISRGGDEVEVLQADNQWRASAAGGKLQLTIQGGDDRFELQDSTLTVSRFGKSVVTLRVKQAAAAPVAAKQQEVRPKPEPTVANSNREKPFIVTRKGQPTGEYNSLYGALSAVATDDVIEVHSNGPVILTMPEAISKALHLRAGKGYRPLLVLKQRTVINHGLVIEDCDIDHRTGDWVSHGPISGSWQFRRCRFWGGIVAGVCVPQLIVEDCIFDTVGGFNLNAYKPTEIVITNCAIRSPQRFLHFSEVTAPVTVRLTGSTFRFRGAGALAQCGTVKTAIKFEATGNVFEFHSTATWGFFIAANWQAQVDWHGQDNLYCGKWHVEHAADGKLIGEGLTAWNKFWKQPEQNSLEIDAVSFAGAQSGEWSSAERVVEIRTAVEKIKSQHNLERLGPDWSLVGVGDSYLRALAAQGKAVPKDRLRPKVHADGPIVIIRNDTEFKGFLTLTAALEVAETGDVIEIRTDDPIPGAEWEGKSRRLTLRAAAGYSPIINSRFYTAQDRFVVEGLTFRGAIQNSGNPPSNWNGEGPPFPGSGCFERLTNCVFLNPDSSQVVGWFRGEGDQVPEITNCVLGQVAAGLPGGKTLRIRNSVLASAWISVDSQDEPGHLEISDSLLWTPDSVTTWGGDFSIYTRSPLTVTSRHSVFVSQGPLMQIVGSGKLLRGWAGSQNVYVKPGEFMATLDSGSLDEWRKLRNADSDSIELLPFSFDAENWRVWRERTTGYQPRQDGTDFGADIDRLLERHSGNWLAP